MEVIDHGDQKSLILIDQNFKTRISQSSLLSPKYFNWRKKERSVLAVGIYWVRIRLVLQYTIYVIRTMFYIFEYLNLNLDFKSARTSASDF